MLGYEDLSDHESLRHDPLHGKQEGRFFHGYYNNYCYLPLYVFCGEHLLCATLRRASIDGSAGALEEVARIVAQIRSRWPETQIILRADSGFCREALIGWCEGNGVDYVFGLVRNERLQRVICRELHEARAASERPHRPARRFRDFTYRTKSSWGRRWRVIGRAEHAGDKANPRFVVTGLPKERWEARALYEGWRWQGGATPRQVRCPRRLTNSGMRR